MDNKPQSSGTGPPPKPWERAGSSSGPGPFKPASSGSTSDVVEASGTAKPGEIVQTGDASTAMNRNSLGRPVPPRPWEQQTTYGANTYGGVGTTYGSGVNYNSSYGAGGMYGGSSYGGVGGGYGTGGLYGNNMYRGGGYSGLYGGGGGMYGGGLGGGLGGGMYGGGMGGPMGGYGMGGPMGGPFDEDPNNPYNGPPRPPGFWVSVMRVMQGVVTFFGRIAILIDQNTQAFHMFMSALLQLFDRSGMLYGELARFVLRILGVKTPKRVPPNGPPGGPHQGGQNYIEGPKTAPPQSGAWDGVWGNN